MEKSYLYKIYNSAGTFLTTWTDVVSPLNVKYEINGGLSVLKIRLARPETGYGENIDVKQGNRIKIYCFDLESGVSGTLVYSGVLNSYTPTVEGSEEFIDVTFFSHYWDLANKILETISSTEINSSSYKNSANLKAYYRFESGALTTDSSGNSHILTAISDPAEDASGKFGGAVALDANDAYSIVDHADFKPTGAYTVGAWVKLSGTATVRSIMSSWAVVTNYYGFLFRVVDSSGYISFISAKGTGTTSGVDFTSVVGTTNVCDGNWNFIVATSDGTNLKVYVNGALQGTTAWSYNTVFNATNYVYVGTRKDTITTQDFLNGSIDDVFLLNGVALTVDEVNVLYNGGTSITYSSYDPSNILKDLLDKYSALTGSVLDYATGTIDLTSTTVSYTYNTTTYQEAVKKVIELCPDGWYFRIGADDLVYLKAKEVTPTHKFTIGRDILSYSPEKRFENIVNTIYFRGGDTGGGVYLYKKYTNSSSVTAYGTRAETIIDQRVTTTATAQIMANRVLNEKSSPEIRVVLKVLDSNNENTLGYNIESIKVGETCKILNATSKSYTLWDEAFWDIDAWDYDITNLAGSQLQIMSIDYYPDYAILELSNKQPDISKRIEDIDRNFEANILIDNPTAPS